MIFIKIVNIVLDKSDTFDRVLSWPLYAFALTAAATGVSAYAR